MKNDTHKHKGQRQQLIDALRAKDIHDERVLEAMNAVPRHRFFDSSFEAFAYRDAAFPIRADQTISQPYTVAFQSQLLRLEPGAKVLEIGTGSGYQAAVLVEMGFKVFSIERQKSLFDFAKLLLPELGYRLRQKFGDGYLGMPTFAPFDGIIVTAAAPSVPQALLDQLSIGGVLIIPVGEDAAGQVMHRVTRIAESKWETESMGLFRFVPMLKDVNRSS